MPTIEQSQVSQATKLQPEDEEVLQSLRSAWLADVAAAPEKYAPRPLPRDMKLRRSVERTREVIAAWLESIKKSAAQAISAKAERRRIERENSNRAEQPAPPVTVRELAERGSSAAPSAPAKTLTDEEVLLHLRNGWLADVQAAPERHAPKPVTWTMKLRQDFEPILDELTFWFECLKEFALRAISPKTKRRQVEWGERARRAETGRRLISALFVGTVVIAALVYLTVVQHIFDADRLSQALRK